MMLTETCERVHQFFIEDKYDRTGLEHILSKKIGNEEFANITMQIEEHYQIQPKDIRTIFEMLDQRVCELKQTGGGSEMIRMQR